MLKIDYRSLFQKGIKPLKEDFGIFLICGYQGSGKGYFSVYNLLRNHKGSKCKTNVKTLITNENEIEYLHRPKSMDFPRLSLSIWELPLGLICIVLFRKMKNKR